MRDDEVERLKRDLAERDELLAFVAHELRNPLHAIGLLVSSARSCAERAGALQAVERIGKAESSIHRYNDRASALLDLARIATSGINPSGGRVDLGVTITELVATYREEASAARVDLVLGPMAEGAVAEIEPRLIEHVVGNLIGNAVRHAGASRITVSVNRSDGSQHVSISVADNGRGISEDDQLRIFAKFKRGSATSTTTGSGLGLWIAKRLATAVQGSITLESIPPSGSRFLFEFPLTAIAMGAT